MEWVHEVTHIYTHTHTPLCLSVLMHQLLCSDTFSPRWKFTHEKEVVEDFQMVRPQGRRKRGKIAGGKVDLVMSVISS